MDEIMAICIVGIVTWGIYRLFELFARRKERLAIIDKLGSKMNAVEVEDALNLPLFKKPDNSSWALKLSLLMIGIGLGAIIAFFIQYSMIGDLLTKSIDDWEIRKNINGFKEMIYFACIAVFGGIGLLSAFLIELKISKK